MQIVVYLPNLTKNTGGAEVYGLWVASALSQSHNVTILTEEADYQDFDINTVFKKYNINPINTDYYRIPHLRINRYTYVIRRIREYALMKYLSTHQCDLFVNATYGKLVIRGTEKRIHIIYFPASKGKGIWGRIRDNRYIKSYSGFISISDFTKQNLQLMYGVTSDIVAPPIAMECSSFSDLNRKERIILAVDRIVPDKCLIEMITTFKQIIDNGYSGFRFVIVGNKDTGEMDYYSKIEKMSKNYPIELHTDVGYEELVSWYKKALIFWHAKGFGISDQDPFNMEHFGMTTVEAMKNGCIPIVINKAGPREVVSKVSEELLWDSLEELKDKTISVISNEETIKALQKKVLGEAQKYNIDSFKLRIVEVVERYL